MPSPALPPGPDVLSVSHLNRLVRDCLETAFPLFWVGGEISNLTYAASGHVYFTLKDSSAQVRCVMWRSRAQLLGWRLENGQRIEARALVSFYEPRGEFQLNIEAVRKAGQGDLFERFLRLKARLEQEGLFAESAKRPLPDFPQRLAIVTSRQAAALRDVLSTLQRRAPHLRLALFCTPVQGEGAAERIAAALAAAGQSGADAVILCRGGGSIEDLWSFNEEIVARAIRACPLPVVAGIGHETDFTIADFAADRRAATPTGAAELLSPPRDALLASLAQQAQRLNRCLRHQLGTQAQHLDLLALRLTHPAERLARQRQTLLDLQRRLHEAGRRQMLQRRWALDLLAHRLPSPRQPAARLGERLHQAGERLNQALRWKISREDAKLNALGSSLTQLDPLAVLSRGYALVTTPDGRTVYDARSLHPGDRLNIALAHGAVRAEVDQLVARREEL